jgi:L-lactate dehydrogenase complex protein LldG
MPSGRDEILAAIRSQRAPDSALPAIENGLWITYADPAAQFASVLAAVGGTCLRAATIDDVKSRLAQMPSYSAATKVFSLCDGIPNRDVDPRAIADPHDLEDVDFAVLPAHFAVAENAAVWVTDEGVPDRVIYFLAQHVALIVPAAEIVHNMHQAYQRLRFDKTGFGCFISGPSKTADIEQSLVIGAHGARSLTVFLLGAS